jgi:hypothetical protein
MHSMRNPTRTFIYLCVISIDAMMVSTNEGAVSPSQLGTRHLFFREIELLINKLNKPSKQHIGGFIKDEYCS